MGSTRGDLDITDNTLTLSTWIKPKDWGNGEHNPFITKGDTQYALKHAPNNALSFFVYSDANWHNVKHRIKESHNNSWHLVTGTYDGNELRLYMDGELKATESCSVSIDHAGYPVNFARNAGKPTRYTQAAMHDVRIYDRALSEEEVSDLWNREPVDNDQLAGHWKMNKLEKSSDEDRYLGWGSTIGNYYNGAFCANGLVFGDRKPKPALMEFKKVSQPVSVRGTDPENGKIRVSNKYNFTNLNRLELVWELVEDSTTLQDGEMSLDIAPRQRKNVDIPFSVPSLKAGAEYWLNLSFQLGRDTIWADKGHEVARAQVKVPFDVPDRTILSAEQMDPIEVRETDAAIEVSGAEFRFTFSKTTGTLSSIHYNNTEIMQKGPRLNVWADIINGTAGEWSAKKPAFDRTLQNMERTVESIDLQKVHPKAARITCETVTTTGEGNGFRNDYTYTVYGSGDLILTHKATPQGNPPSHLPKMGIEMRLPGDFNRFSWYGRGPHETYPKRKTSGTIGVYRGSVMEQYTPFPVPQEHGNKSDCRYAVLTDGQGVGLAVISRSTFNVSVHRHTNITDADYTYDLVMGDDVILDIDHKYSDPSAEFYRLPTKTYQYSIRFRPFTGDEASAVKLKRQKLPRPQR